MANSASSRAALVLSGVSGRSDRRRGGLRQYRFLGRHRAGPGLARTVRRCGQQQLQRDTRRQRPDPALDPLGQGVAGGGGSAQLAQLARGERANTGRLLADGVGERRQRPAAVVHPAIPRRRHLRPVVRRLRQSLRRPARGDTVLPGHPVDSLASPGNRNALHAKDSRARSSCWLSRIWGRCRFSTAIAAPWSAIRWTWSTTSTRATSPAGSRIADRPGQAARSQRRRHSRQPAGWWCSACGSRAPPRRCWSG